MQSSLRHSSNLPTEWAILPRCHTICTLHPLLPRSRTHYLSRSDSYCLVGIAIMLFGVLYWAGWRIILPKVFGYELVPRKEVLNDGTVITLVRFLPFSNMPTTVLTCIPLVLSSKGQEGLSSPANVGHVVMYLFLCWCRYQYFPVTLNNGDMIIVLEVCSHILVRSTNWSVCLPVSFLALSTLTGMTSIAWMSLADNRRTHTISRLYTTFAMKQPDIVLWFAS